MALIPVPGFVWDRLESSNGLSLEPCMYVCMYVCIFFPKGAGRAIWPGVLGFMPHWVVSSVVVGHLEVRTVC